MRKWNFEFTDIAEGDIDRLEDGTRKRILEKITWFCGNFDILTPLPLGGPWRGFFKLRIGDWRIVYDVDAETMRVTVHLIDHRTKIYKRKKPV